MRQVKNFWKLETCGNFLRPIKSIFVRNYKFGSNLKIGHFGPKMGIMLIVYSDERIINKKLQFAGLKI